MEDQGTERRIRKVDRRICPHCNKNVSYKTYKSHRRLYFNVSLGTWIINQDEVQVDPEDCVHEMNDSPPGSPDHFDLGEQDYDPPCSNYGKFDRAIFYTLEGVENNLFLILDPD